MNRPGGVTWGPIRQYHRFPLVTFVIPSLGRDSLRRTLRSLQAQSLDGKWRALVVFDGPEAYEKVKPWFDGLVTDGSGQFCGMWPAEPLNSAGLLRNYGLAAIENMTKFPYFNSQWVAFLDDDDHLHTEYVQELNDISAYAGESIHCVVFRMKHPQLGVLPDPENPRLEWGQVGISFAVQKWLIDKYSARFIRERETHIGGPDRNEDINFLQHIMVLCARHDAIAEEWRKLGKDGPPVTDDYVHPPGAPYNVYLPPDPMYFVREAGPDAE